MKKKTRQRIERDFTPDQVENYEPDFSNLNTPAPVGNDLPEQLQFIGDGWISPPVIRGGNKTIVIGGEHNKGVLKELVSRYNAYPQLVEKAQSLIAYLGEDWKDDDFVKDLQTLLSNLKNI